MQRAGDLQSVDPDAFIHVTSPGRFLGNIHGHGFNHDVAKGSIHRKSKHGFESGPTGCTTVIAFELIGR
jgi:hypothetical protein